MDGFRLIFPPSYAFPGNCPKENGQGKTTGVPDLISWIMFGIFSEKTDIRTKKEAEQSRIDVAIRVATTSTGSVYEEIGFKQL